MNYRTVIALAEELEVDRVDVMSLLTLDTPAQVAYELSRIGPDVLFMEVRR